MPEFEVKISPVFANDRKLQTSVDVTMQCNTSDLNITRSFHDQIQAGEVNAEFEKQVKYLKSINTDKIYFYLTDPSVGKGRYVASAEGITFNIFDWSMVMPEKEDQEWNK